MLRPMDSRLQINDWLKVRIAAILQLPYTQDERARSAEIFPLCVRSHSLPPPVKFLARAGRQSGIRRSAESAVMVQVH